MIPRRAARRDTTEAEIVEALAAVGMQPFRCSDPGLPDLWAALRGRWYGIEIKSRWGKLTPAQVLFHRVARGPVVVLRSVSEALEWARQLP